MEKLDYSYISDFGQTNINSLIGVDFICPLKETARKQQVDESRCLHLTRLAGSVPPQIGM